MMSLARDDCCGVMPNTRHRFHRMGRMSIDTGHSGSTLNRFGVFFFLLSYMIIDKKLDHIDCHFKAPHLVARQT